MAYLLGVDTGGTYTDAVILDEAADAVIGKAKSLTTRADLALGMRKGSFFVSFTKRLSCQDFKILEHEMYRMSWGEATVYIMQKTTDPREPPPPDV